MHQEREYPARVSGTELHNPDFAAMARAFGLDGEIVTRTAEFRPALERALARKGSTLLELRIDPDAITTRTTLTALRTQALARLRSIVRRSAGHATSVVNVGDISLDERQMKISMRGVPVTLSPLEYRLAAYLLLHRGRVVSQQELSENIYGQDDAHDSNAIEVLIGRVRRKLGADVIETRRGFGYLVPAAAP